MNLIGARPDRWWRDRDAAVRRLIQELEEYAARTGETVTVMFDYRPRDLRVGTAGGVKARFADGGPQAADRAIFDLVSAHPHPGTVTVVTSDRALRQGVQAAGARVLGAGEFRERMEGAPDG